MNPEEFLSSTAGSVIRTPQDYWVFLPHPLPPEIQWSPALISAAGEAERSLARLDALAGTLPSPHVIVRPFIHREAVLSSRIEGTRASLSDVYVYQAGRQLVRQPDTDVREVHNYVTALDHGVRRLATLPVSLRLLREVHALLMEGVRGEHLTPGEFRRSQNWIGAPGSTLATAAFVPPPVDEMQAALAELEKFIHAPSDLPPLIRNALIHYQFEAIHPFLDGNGRIGRLLAILLLIEWGLLARPWLYLSGYFEAHRLAYYDHLLAVSQRGAWEPWLLFFLQGVLAQSQDAVQRIESLQQLRAGYVQQLATQRASARLTQAVDVLFERPILNIGQLAAAMEVPFRTAQRYVERLEALGVLREVTGRARDRIYQADEILILLEGPGSVG